MNNNIEYKYMKLGGVRPYCPVCGHEHQLTERVFSRDFRGMSAVVPFSSYDVYACPICGMVYAGDMEESMPLTSYYAKMSRYEGNHFVLSPKLKAFYEREALFLRQYITQDTRVLDIGCAFGGLLATMKRMGFHRLYGLEPSKKNAQYANAHFGVKVYEGTLGKNLHEKYDVVILSAVMEHLVDLHKAINEVKEYLAEGGKVFFAVPELTEFSMHADLYQEFSIEHINYFSVPALRQLMQRHGMKLQASHIDREMFMGLGGNSFTLWEDGNEGEIPAVGDFVELKAYLERSARLADKIREKLSRKYSADGFYLWAAGTQTAMLYQLKLIEATKVRGIFDSNRNMEGEVVFGHRVSLPEKLKDMPPYPILISSAYAQSLIQKSAQEMNLRNPLWNIW